MRHHFISIHIIISPCNDFMCIFVFFTFLIFFINVYMF